MENEGLTEGGGLAEPDIEKIESTSRAKQSPGLIDQPGGLTAGLGTRGPRRGADLRRLRCITDAPLKDELLTDDQSMKWAYWAIFVAVLLLVAYLQYSPLPGLTPLHAAMESESTIPRLSGPFQPIPPASSHLDAEKVALGRRLFNDTRFDSHGRSCASCHPVDFTQPPSQPASVTVTIPPPITNPNPRRRSANAAYHGASKDKRTVNGSVSAADKSAFRDPPTLFNCDLKFRFRWDGSVSSLHEAVEQAMEGSDQLGIDLEKMVATLKADDSYHSAFENYDEGVTVHNVQDALVEYLRSLRTPGSRFDRYLAGELHALNDQERRGLDLFRSLGCGSCHQGRLLGGNLFQKFGVYTANLKEDAKVSQRDIGRFLVTSESEDRYCFRVPGLRNVSRTAPYFHGGQAATLHEAVEAMANYQLGRPLEPEQIEQIVAFLSTLDGRIPTPDATEQKGAAK